MDTDQEETKTNFEDSMTMDQVQDSIRKGLLIWRGATLPDAIVSQII